MTEERKQNVHIVTPKTIYNTTIFDDPTYLWFKTLCELPSVKKKLITSSPSIRCNYHYYTLLKYIARSFLAICAVLSAIIFIFEDKRSIMLLLGTGVLLVSTIVILKIKRHYLALIAAQFINQNLSEIHPKTTLYEMSELYSERYGIHSIVDLIWISDHGFRFIVMGTIFFGFSILFLKMETIVILFAGILGIFLLCLHGGLFKRKTALPKTSFDTKQ